MRAILFLVAAMIAACGTTQKPVETKTSAFPATLDEVLVSSYRTPGNEQRDQYRHPKQTLEFFGLKPDMTVIEVSPGAGWYAEILAPYLAAKGKYIAAAVPVSIYGGGQKFLDYLDAHPELKSKVTITDFAPPKMVDIAPENSADLVVTFRNVHNWANNGGEQAAFHAFFKALKKGGTLGVVEHRAVLGTKDPKFKSGYVPERTVIGLAKKAGFKLVEKSEINANPKDKKNYRKGVWTLPPSYAEGEKDRAKYTAIGESDRMTLKFVKP